MRELILSQLENLLLEITGEKQTITEDKVLYGISKNKLDISSLELVEWITSIECQFDMEIALDICCIGDIVDCIISKKSGEKNEL